MSLLHDNSGTSVSPVWEAETRAFIEALEDKLGLLDPAIGNAFNTLIVVAKAAAGVFNITVSADGISLTSSKLVGILVPVISMDGQIRYAGADFRKGADGADAAAQKASDTITIINPQLITDGVALYNGQVVTIIPGTT